LAICMVLAGIVYCRAVTARPSTCCVGVIDTVPELPAVLFMIRNEFPPFGKLSLLVVSAAVPGEAGSVAAEVCVSWVAVRAVAGMENLLRGSGGEIPVFTYDVAVSSHDLLKQGITEAAYIHVVVAAKDDTEAALIACQMAACHGMPTKVYREV
jgi:hypothetical protein